MKPYDEEHEIAEYVWQHYRGLFTPAEKRAHWPYLWERMKVEKKRDVVEHEWKRHRIAEDAEVMALLADGVEAFHRRAARRVLEEHGDEVFLNRCPRCGRVVRTPMARKCLWCGHDWHLRDPRLLVEAAFRGKLDRIEELLRGGADIEAPDETWTPLHAAVENAQPEAVRLLLERGADPNGMFGGWTPLFHALESEWDAASNGKPFVSPTPECSAILIRYGADPNLPAPDGRSLLDWLRALRYPEAVEMLLAAGARSPTAPPDAPGGPARMP